jgi:hypothetical protein
MAGGFRRERARKIGGGAAGDGEAMKSVEGPPEHGGGGESP